jgi:hypothetical protein
LPAFGGEIALEWNGYCLSWLRKIMPGYRDVNAMAEDLAKKTGIPLVPTTDLHARSRRLLGAMGTSYIEIPLENMNFEDVLGSLRRNVLVGKFTPHKECVSFWHFAEAFGIPLLRKIIAGR